MPIIYEDAEIQVIETVTANGKTVQTINKPGSRGANEAILQGQLETLFDNLRTVANGSGTFANNTVRDAAIRTIARALVVMVRIYQRKLDATD